MRIDLTAGRVDVDVDVMRDPGECVFEVLRGAAAGGFVVAGTVTAPGYENQGRWAIELVSTFDDQVPAGAVLRVWLDGFDPGLVFDEPEVTGRYEREEVL